MGTECFDEIKESLEVFINQRMDRKSSSLEAVLCRIVKDFVDTFQNLKPIVDIQYSDIWSKIINGEITGDYNPNKPHEYETLSYGTIYRDTLSRTIADQFGAGLAKNNKGSVIKINVEKFRKIEKVYSEVVEKQFKIKVWLNGENPEDEKGKYKK